MEESKIATSNKTVKFKNTYYNLPIPKLIDTAIIRSEGLLTSNGALSVKTGKYTGRSPKDRFVVDEPLVTSKINWGNINQPFPKDKFRKLYNRVMDYLSNRDIFVYDGAVGADEKYQLPIRAVTEYAWHNLFVRQLFQENKISKSTPEFTIISAPGFKAVPERDGTNSEVFVLISFEERTVLIGGTEYAGEIKKSIFSVLNYLLPHEEVLPMHCSANIGKHNDVSLFFGLSGTGKTTLSADPSRQLIGDDEHGWSNDGVFNFEGGCYAKCVGLKREKEPQIYEAIKFGSVIENVAVDSETRVTNFDDVSLTENTRAAYPITHIPGAVSQGKGGHPNVLIFLTADAFGVFPPVAKLTKEQAMYHFLSGYTSKLAGTERNVTAPEATFSTCFGAPFMPLNPGVYAEMLGHKIERHNVQAYLVNTGWTGGPYGEGERINLSYTRAIISALQNKTIEQASFHNDPIFNVLVPDQVPGVPPHILTPEQTWNDKSKYQEKARILADKFRDNFNKFNNMPKNIQQAGPTIN